MKALVTGASSGIGRDMAKVLAKKGYDLIIVARRKELLEELKNEIVGFAKINIEIEVCDVSQKENCVKLFEKYKDIDLLINNAGFGLFGVFVDCDLEREIDMINTNIIAVHTLTKLYVCEMKNRGNGQILNVASLAGFMSGPLMSTYYATKNYVVQLSRAINTELRKAGSNVKISVLCPGPVNTNFNKVAGVKFGVKSLSSEYVAKYAINKMLARKEIIVPGLMCKIAVNGMRFVPNKLLNEIVYKLQTKKSNK